MSESSFQCLPVDGGEAVPPTPVYLFFADGVTAIPNGRSCQGATVPPAFQCKFALDGDPASCARQVQGFLDRWFAPYNVYFTLTRPPAGPYDTVVITSTGGWCKTTTRGATQLTCSHRASDAAYALACDDDPKHCAILIAHEYGHLVGLAHTDSETDLMYADPCTECDGFRNANISVPDRTCRDTQNSNEEMCKALRARSAVPAPTDSVHCTDVGPPRLAVTTPQEGAVYTDESVWVSATAQDECGVQKVTVDDGHMPTTLWDPAYERCLTPPAGDDAIVITATDNAGQTTSRTVHVQTVITQPDAGTPPCRPPPPPDSGCHCDAGGAGARPTALALALALLIARRRSATPRARWSIRRRTRSMD